jgi:hypothetical protein
MTRLACARFGFRDWRHSGSAHDSLESGILPPASSTQGDAPGACIGAESSCALGFELETRLGQAVKLAPDEAVHRHHHERNEDCGQEQHGKSATIRGGIDLGA